MYRAAAKKTLAEAKKALGKARADLTTRIVPLGVALLGVGNRRALPGRTCLFENSSLRVPMVQIAVHVLGDLGVPALDEKIECLEEVSHQVVLAGVELVHRLAQGHFLHHPPAAEQRPRQAVRELEHVVEDKRQE